MRYTMRKSIIEVVGRIWMPAIIISHRYTLTDYDVNNAKDDDGNLTRESVERWLCFHSGDFQSVVDFHASLEDGDKTIDFPWQNEDSECTYCDSMFPVETE